jgi:SAM-dependent methyltransferase
MKVFAFLTLISAALRRLDAFKLADYAHYFDYLPYRQEGLAGFEDFRTAPTPPSHLRNRKMEIGGIKLEVEDVLANPIWPAKWPYGFEDFRPLDYTRDVTSNTLAQYQYSQSLLKSDFVTLFPGLLRVPIQRHFIFPKDKFALAEHYSQYFFDGCSVLELFSCYDSILPPRIEYGPTVGVGWYGKEMKANPSLDDYIEQDITVDPYLPIADNFFDFVVCPANFQLFQRPLETFQEINRVLKPGGTAFIGVKLAHWSFLQWKQGRYYVETNYLEDILAVGSFFHFAGGFNKPEAFDLTLPELNIVGKIKDVAFPQPRLDFYAVVQARKRKDSPHGKNTVREPAQLEPEIIEGAQYRPKIWDDVDGRTLGPFF